MQQAPIVLGPEDKVRADAFWAFSAAIWQERPVEDACLRLQTDESADANIILFLCWLAREGWGPLEEPIIRAAMEISQPWQAGVVQPLRKLRQELKEMPMPEARSIRASVQQSEIAAERAEQGALVVTMAVLNQSPTRPDVTAAVRSAMGGVDIYLSLLNDAPCESQGRDQLQAALRASSIYAA